jgi:O-antigen/teichoic acid export membrane protein
MLAFGGNLTASNVLNYLVRNLDNILLGAVWGATSVGLYSKAYGLLMLPIRQVNGPLTAVAIPALSSLQNNPDGYRRYYVKAIAILAFLSMPLIVFALCSAKEVVLLILGQQWVDSIPIFMALAPAALLGSLNVVTGWVFIPLGRTDRKLRSNFFGSAVTVTAFIIGLRWGPLGVASAFSAAALIKRFPQIMYAYHGTPLRLVDLGRAIWRPALACLVAAAAVIIANIDILIGNLPLRFLAKAAIFLSCYGAVWLAVPGGGTFLRETLGLVKSLRLGSGTTFPALTNEPVQV